MPTNVNVVIWSRICISFSFSGSTKHTAIRVFSLLRMRWKVSTHKAYLRYRLGAHFRAQHKRDQGVERDDVTYRPKLAVQHQHCLYASNRQHAAVRTCLLHIGRLSYLHTSVTDRSLKKYIYIYFQLDTLLWWRRRWWRWWCHACLCRWVTGT